VPWFPVDDSFHSHPKALATSLAARGLWATAGSWSSAHLTDGVVPVHVLASLGGTPELAAELVAAGLWRRTRQGYVFHDWLDWGSKRTAAEIRQLRKVRADAGRKGGEASGRKRANSVNSPKQPGSKPGLLNTVNTPQRDTRNPDDVRKQASKREAKTKQVASRLPRGGLNPNTSTTTKSVADAGNQSSRRNARDDPETDETDEILTTIIQAIYAATSRVIDPAWAAKIRDHILNGHQAGNPAAYVRKVIENDPDPRTRFLEH
jgi:hypothetical protein